MKNKLIITLFLVIGIIITTVTTVQADSSISDAISGADSFLSSGQSGNVVINKSTLKETSDSLFNTLLTAGIVIAVIISSALGIKFMIGSIEEKAQVKETLIPFVIGCIVIFGAFTIWKIVVTIGSSL